MLKKILAIILCLSLLLCTSCNNNKPPIIDKPESIVDTQVEEIIPEHIQTINNRYSQWVSENLDTTKIQVSNHIKDEGKFFSFLIHTYPDADSGEDVQFWKKSNNEVLKSFSVFFDKEYSAAALRNFIALTIYVVNPDMSYLDCEKIMEEMIASYDGINPSDIHHGPDYSVFISNFTSLSTTIVNVVSHEEINVPINKEDYENLGFEASKSKLNKERLVVVEGKISSIEINESRAYITLVDQDENEHYIVSSFNDVLDNLVIDDTYRFYVSLLGREEGNKPCSRSHFYESVD